MMGKKKQLSSNSNMQLKQLKWVYHNNTGYILEEQIMLLYKICLKQVLGKISMLQENRGL